MKTCNEMSLNGPFSNCSDPVLVRIASRSKLVADRLAEGKAGMRRLPASVGRLASDIASSAVPPSRVHFAGTQLIRKEELRRSICKRLRPMQQCTTNHTKCVCCLSKPTRKGSSVLNFLF